MVTVNEFFNEVYCINMLNSTNRWQTSRARFVEENIIPKRIEAITPEHPQAQEIIKRLDNPDLQEIEPPRPFQDPNFSERSVAAYQSHLTCIEDALQQGHHSILVLEDDIVFHNDFQQKFNDSIELLPDDWDIWLLGGFQHQWDNTVSINDKFYISDNTMGMFAYAISETGLRKFAGKLKEYALSKLNVDTVLGYILMKDPEFKIGVSWPHLIGHDTLPSITRDGKNEDYYGFFPKDKYNYEGYKNFL